jgi:hypothetical protein
MPERFPAFSPLSPAHWLLRKVTMVKIENPDRRAQG